MDESAIECQSLTAGYHGKPVLQEVSLELPAGTVTALLGPNGSGKSTLLKTLSKTLAPQSGQVLVAGRPIQEIGFKELARLIGFVPYEEPATFPFTVRQVVIMGRLPHTEGLMDTAEDRDEADKAMAEADCTDLADRPITELSAGERQRVLIARALAQRAPILLMDEPTAHLDVQHQLGVGILMNRFAAEGKTVAAAIHDLNFAAAYCQRAILLQKGRLILSGPVEQVLESEKLDEVYGVRFSRTKTNDGGIRLFPDSPVAAGATRRPL